MLVGVKVMRKRSKKLRATVSENIEHRNVEIEAIENLWRLSSSQAHEAPAI